jgi:two-component sensor histidine kinase
MVLTELVQNAVEHGYPGPGPGSVEVLAERSADELVVEVRDDGAGLPAGFDLEASDRLGLRIVRTLVEGELRGTLALRSGQPGTVAVVRVPLEPV